MQTPLSCCKEACKQDTLLLPLTSTETNYFQNLDDLTFVYHLWNRVRRDTVSIAIDNCQRVHCVLLPWIGVHHSIANAYLKQPITNINSIRINSPVVYIPSNANWYHWLVDSFAYLIHLAQNERHVFETHKIVLGAIETYQLELYCQLLERYSITSDPITVTLSKNGKGTIIFCEQAAIPNITVPVVERLHLVRKYFSNIPLSTGDTIETAKRLAIKRDGCNRIINQDELYTCLAANGFQLLSPARLNIYEKIKVFSSCDQLFIPSGSDRSHFQTLCPPTCTSIFLVPQTLITSQIQWVYGAWRYWYEGFERTHFSIGIQEGNDANQEVGLAIDAPCYYDLDHILGQL